VTVAFAASDATSGVAGCTAPVRYGGPDSAAAAVVGSCRDAAGNTSGAAGLTFRYDATAPLVTAKAERTPDGAGWYRRPFAVTFAATDPMSGVAECTAPVRYSGPDRAGASVAGSCRDAAGNVAEQKLSFDYDATAPALTPKAEIVKGVARVSWKRTADIVRVEIVRRPGLNGARATTLYRGTGATFADSTVRDGVRYRYEVSAADRAGNVARRTVAAHQRALLYSPVAGAVVAPGRLVLRWQASAGARFYNVQLFRNGVKVLTAWPRAVTLAVPARLLTPGRYRWYVWPSRGTRERPRYTRPLGTSHFTVKRR
jgi:hypothetical protein